MNYRTRLLVQSFVTIAAVAILATLLDGRSSNARLVATLAMTAGVAFATAHLLSAYQRRTVAVLSESVRALAAGEATVRPHLAASGELGELSDSLRGVAEQLSTRMAALQMEDALLGAVIESLNEGVIVLSDRGEIIRINSVGRELLALGHDELPVGVERLPRDAVLHRAIHAALRGTATGPVEITIPPRQLALTATPLRGSAGGGGAAVALFDLTQLRRLEQIRRDFVANVSHELRTPLTVVSGFAETLADDDPDPEHRRQFVQAILNHTGRMQRIVDDLLDLSRIESRGWVPQPEELDLRELCDEVVAGLQRPEGKVELRVEGEAPAVYADRTALRQIVSNLAENSLRHTESGEIVVAIEPADEGVWLRVRDTGTGIPAEHVPRIFERFYRADSARTRQRGGTGLGLAIVKHLAEAHGGSVQASSEVGRGTTISVFLPRMPAQLELLTG